MSRVGRALGALDAGLRAAGWALENPLQPLSGERLLSTVSSPDEIWYEDGRRRRDPLTVGVVYRAAQIISSMVAGCPIEVTDTRTNEELPFAPVQRPLTGPTAFELWQTTVLHMMLWGNAFLRKGYDRRGVLQVLIPIHPGRVVVRYDDASVEQGLPFAKRFEIDGKVELTPEQVMHIPNMSVDGILGVSVVGNMRRLFDIAVSAELAADKMFERGMLSSGFLTTEQKLTADSANTLKSRWRARVQGIDNAADVAILDQGMKFEQLSMHPKDAQFLESRQFTRSELAMLLGVPGWMVNDAESERSGRLTEQQWKAMVLATIKPYTDPISQRIERELLSPFECATFDLDELMAADAAARAQFYNLGITGGWLVPNEAREEEGLPPVAWGDEPYLPFNTSAGAQEADKAEDAAEPADDEGTAA